MSILCDTPTNRVPFGMIKHPDHDMENKVNPIKWMWPTLFNNDTVSFLSFPCPIMSLEKYIKLLWKLLVIIVLNVNNNTGITDEFSILFLQSCHWFFYLSFICPLSAQNFLEFSFFQYSFVFELIKHLTYNLI